METGRTLFVCFSKCARAHASGIYLNPNLFCLVNEDYKMWKVN